jgi:nucleoside-diphosphate-sugar epimerase
LLVNDFTYRAFKDEFILLYESHFKRNYIHILDIARVFLFCIEENKTNNQIFNVGLSDTNISKLELCKRIKNILPKLNIIESHYKKDPDQRNYIVSNEKIEKFGFKTKYSLEDGIYSLLKSFKILKNNFYGNI